MKPADSKTVPLPKVAPSDRLGAVVPVPPVPPAPAALAGADLTNVIVLSHRRSTGEIEAPAVSVDDNARPAPVWSWADRTPWTALIAGALLLHLALVLMFMRDPAPIPSLAIDSISVEVVLGGQTEAGVAEAPSPEQSAPSPASESVPDKPQVTEEPPTEIAEQVKPDLKPRIEPAEPQREEPKPEEPQTAAAEPEPAPSPAEPEPAPAVAEQEPAPTQTEPEEAKPVEEPVAQEPPPKPEPKEPPRPQAKPSPPRVAAAPSGVGVGRSVKIENYLNQTAQHLARHQRTVPTDVRMRKAGRWVARVRFTFDEGGRVTSIRLTRSSGIASLDAEALAIVRRASPIPAPPPDGPRYLTVPVVFTVTETQ